MTESGIRVNLHTHSTMSDGELSPESLAALLAARGAAYASLTDHDTSSGSAAFRESLARHGIGCVDGIELTVETQAGQAHILAYGMDMADPGLVALLPRQGGGDARAERRTGPRSAGAPPIQDALQAVHAAGGAAFLAHPFHLSAEPGSLDSLVTEFAAMGLDGLEAVYAGYGPERQAALIAMADRHGLAICAGGDFHGGNHPGQSDIMDMPEDRWIAFRDLLLRRSGGMAPGSESQGEPRAEAPSRRPLPAKLAARIVLPAIIAIGLFIVFLFLLFIPRDESVILERKKETIQELTDVAVSVLAEYEAKASSGSMSVARAQSEAVARLRDLRYGRDNKDYFWITDMKPRMIMHPYRSELEGRDLADFRDQAGKAVFVEFVNAVTVREQGYVEYLWQWEDVADRIVPKLSFVRRFKPWDWVIGTGVYMDDVNAEIRSLSLDLVLLCVSISLVMSLILTYMVRQGFAIERGKLAAEAALRESHERYRALADGSTDGTVIVLDGACTFANGAFSAMTGYAQKEIQLLRISELLEDYPDDVDAPAQLPGFPAGPGMPGKASIESRLLKRSGEKIDVFVSESPIALGERQGRVLSIKEANPPAESGTPAAVSPWRVEPAVALAETDVIWLSGPASGLATEFPVCRIDERVLDAAMKMKGPESVDVVVTDNACNAIGIVGPAEIVARSMASGADPRASLTTVMTAPIPSVDSSATVSDAIAAMKASGTTRIALRSPAGSIAGILSASSIGLLYAGSLGSIRMAALAAETVSALADIVSGAAQRLRSLDAAGARPRIVLRQLSGIQDAAAESLARLAIRKLGPAPCPWMFMSFGSMGREEYLPGSDQDNALVWDGSLKETLAERKYFLAMAEIICLALEKIGLPRCPGGVMASSPAWNGPLPEWERRLEAGLREPEPEKLLDLKILLDFRASAGSGALADSLRRKALALMAGQPSFFIHLAMDEKLRKVHNGALRSAQGVNLKELGAAFSGFARLYALKHSIATTNSFDRLDALVRCGAIQPATGDRLSDAYESVMAIRLSRSLTANSGKFSAREEALLGFALEEAALLQKRIGFDFLGSGI